MTQELKDTAITDLPRKQRISLFNLLMTGNVGKHMTDDELIHYIGNHSDEKILAGIEKIAKEDQWFKNRKIVLDNFR